VLPRVRGWVGSRRGRSSRLGGVWLVAVALAVTLLLNHRGGGGALQAFWLGSFGSWYALTSATLVRAVPLILTGLGVAIAFRAGVFNVGAEGQLLFGAVVATIVGLQWSPALGRLALPLALVAGTVAGAAWAGIAAVMRARFGVLEVISTLMLNFLAANLVSYLVRGPLQEPQRIYPQSASLPQLARVPHLWSGTRLHWGLVLAVGLVLVASWAVSRTAAGFRLRIVGANPDAAYATGRISVARVTTRAFLVSGALAGLAGSIEVTAVTYALYENLSPGYGFTAIAVAVLAGLRPIWILPSGVFFAGLEAGAIAMQRDAGVPAAWTSVAEASLILIVVGGLAWRTRTKAAMSAAGVGDGWG
jgi:general nucleoside transport system permease protein